MQVIDRKADRPRDRSYSRDSGQYNRGRGNDNNNNRGYRSNYRDRSRSRNNYGNRRNDRFDNGQIIEGTILDRTMVTKGIEIEV